MTTLSELQNIALGGLELPLDELERELEELCEDCHLENVLILESGACILIQEDSIHLHGLGLDFEQTILRLIFEVRARKLPLRCVFLTHYEKEDRACLQALELLKEMKPRSFPFRILGHSKNEESYGESQFLAMTQQEEFIKLDGRQYYLVKTSGHNSRNDHIAILEMSQKILFVGALLQPQGESYDYCTFLTPVSNHINPLRMNQSLENLKTLPFEWGITHNGEILDRSRTYRWIETTQKTFERTAFYARKVLWEEDLKDLESQARRVYELMCMERNLSLDAVSTRFEKMGDNPTEFEQFDLPSIEFFLKKFGGEQ